MGDSTRSEREGVPCFSPQTGTTGLTSGFSECAKFRPGDAQGRAKQS